MRRTILWLAIIAVITPLLSGCIVNGPSAVQASTQVSLPQAVETYMADLPGPNPKLFLSTRVYDRNGTLLGEFWDEGHRYWVPLTKIAPAVAQGTIATEDKTFYTNPGVDWSAIARAVIQNTGEGDIVSGASTITQQLARNITMPFERRIEQTLDRKVTEAMLAQDLTQRFTKNQILEMYLNVVNYGHLAYGIEAAARTYFGKSAAQLTLAESAMLAGLPQSPALLDPLVPENAERAKSRQGIVLALLAKSGYIKQEEAQAAYAQPLEFKSEQAPTNLVPHFMQYVHDYLAQRYGKDMVGRGGFTVYTSLDLRMQQKAEQIVRTQVAAVRDRYNLSNAALVALKPQTGQILAMVGSADYNNAAIDGQVNVAVSLRQPGSAIKPVLYALAFTRGLTPADLIWDVPASFALKNGQVYTPVNYDGRFHGPVRLRQALANSYNIPAVKLLNRLGIADMVSTAHALGIQSLTGPVENYGLSITLGGAEVTLLDLTGVFAALANAGTPIAPTPVLRLLDNTGHEIASFGQPAAPAVDPRVAYMVTSILSDNEARAPMFGTDSPLKLSRPAAAKTGTTTDWRDNWTVGYTPYLAVGVWAGNSNGQPMRNTTGLTGAAPIWHDFMEATFADPALDRAVRPAAEPLDFARPAGLIDAPICNLAALNQGENGACPASRNDLFIDPARPITIGVPGPAQPAVAGQATPAPTLPASPVNAAAPGPGRAAPVPNAANAVRPSDPAITVTQALLLGSGQICATREGGTPLAVLRLPAEPAERQVAQQWAAQAGLRVEPPACSAGMVESASAASAATGGPPITTQASIISPAAGSVVRGPVNVIGSALFSTQEVQFYKVEFGYGTNPGEWITMGSGHPGPVSGSVLETWHAESLPNGAYALRVVLVKHDGNYVASAPVPLEVQH